MAPLKAHQQRAITYALKNKYCVLGLGPGTGKTRVAIEVREKTKPNCLVICPAYLIKNWENEFKLWAPRGTVVTAFKKSSELYDVFDSDYVLASYDLCQKSEWLFEWAEMVVLEEAHNVKSMKAKRTEYLHRVIYENSIKSLLMLTGTPIKNRVPEWYSLLALCNYDPRIKESAFLTACPDEITFSDRFSFREEYTIEINNRFIPIVKWNGLRNVEDLKGYLKGHYLRIRSEDVLDLPPITFQDIEVTGVNDRELLAAFNAYLASGSVGDSNPTAKAEAALSTAPITVKYATDLLEQIDSLVIYSDHVAASEAIAKAFNVRALNGRVPAHTRMQAVQDFQDGEGRVLVATIGALSAGVNLTRASHMIINDESWVPGDNKQTVYRIQRLGQKSNCFVHRMVSEASKYIRKTLIDKQLTIDAAT